MIYLNHAGTSWPKPNVVNQAMAEFQEQVPPTEWGRVFDEGLETTCQFLGIADPSRFMFTTSCTSSLAIALGDFPWQEGDKLIISHMEHHALSRWYHKLQRDKGVQGIIIPRCNIDSKDGQDGPLDLNKLEEELQKGKVRMVAMTMASNVTGEILPYRQVLQLCRQYGVLCLLDGAQTVGVLRINIKELDPDILVFAGHKGTLGPHGIGGLYISKRVSMSCPTAVCEYIPGQKGPPSIFPSYCDSGSAPMMAMAGLVAGMKWLTEQGWDQLQSHRIQLVRQLRSGLAQIITDNGPIQIVGAATEEWDDYTGAVSIIVTTTNGGNTNATTTTTTTAELNAYLKEHANVVASHGFQCASLAHEALGTRQSGTLRFSVGVMTATSEIDILLATIRAVLGLPASTQLDGPKLSGEKRKGPQ